MAIFNPKYRELRIYRVQTLPSAAVISWHSVEQELETLERTPYLAKAERNRHENKFLLCFLPLAGVFTLGNIASLDEFPMNSYHSFHRNNL